MVEVLLHPAELKGQPVKLVVDFQHVAGFEGAVGGGRCRHIFLDVGAVGRDVFGLAVLVHMEQHLFFQGKPGKLFQPHQLEINGRHIGAALGFDGDHVGDVQHDECLPHRGPADPHFFRQFPVVQRVPGFQLHGDNPAPQGLVRCFARAGCCHRANLLSCLFIFVWYAFSSPYHCRRNPLFRQCTICSNFIK